MTNAVMVVVIAVRSVVNAVVKIYTVVARDRAASAERVLIAVHTAAIVYQYFILVYSDAYSMLVKQVAYHLLTVSDLVVNV